MKEKTTAPALEQITDKMEELEVEKEEIDEEVLAMQAMGLPTSFTSSLVMNTFFINQKKQKFIFLYYRLIILNFVNEIVHEPYLMNN